jgi:hypothetical protein
MATEEEELTLKCEQYIQQVVSDTRERLAVHGLVLTHPEETPNCVIRTEFFPECRTGTLRVTKTLDMRKGSGPQYHYETLKGLPGSKAHFIVERLRNMLVDGIVSSAQEDTATLPSDHPFKNQVCNLRVQVEHVAERQILAFSTSFFCARG